jgi:hypothetical protein
MLFRRLEKLYLHKLSVLDKLNQTYQADADPEVIAIRTSDLHIDLDRVDKEIKFEESMKPFVYMTCGFIICSVIILISTLLNL